MEINEYAMQAYEDSIIWFGSIANDLPHQALGLCGEAGEVGNLVKKIDRGDLDKEELLCKIPEELVDVLVYAFGIAGLLRTMLGIDWEKAYNDKRRTNWERFGSRNQFSERDVRPDVPGEA